MRNTRDGGIDGDLQIAVNVIDLSPGDPRIAAVLALLFPDPPDAVTSFGYARNEAA